MKRLLTLLAVLGLIFTACGDDGDSVDAAGDGGTPADAGSDLYGDSGDDDSGDDGAAGADAGDEGDGGDAGSSGGIVISGFAYQVPNGIVVGDTITVTNEDGAPHTFTAEDGSFGTSTLSGGDSEDVTFDSAGEFAVFCEIHSSMSGSVTVNG